MTASSQHYIARLHLVFSLYSIWGSIAEVLPINATPGLMTVTAVLPVCHLAYKVRRPRQLDDL